MTLLLKYGEEVSGTVGKIYFKYYFPKECTQIVFTFAGAGHSVHRENAQCGISPWGYEYIKKKGVGVFSFSNIFGEYCYYRDEAFFRFLEDVEKGIDKDKERLSYGGSMGGYAASAFANLLNVDRVLLLNPISTRDKNIATWDYEAGRGLGSFNFDWSGEYSDGASLNSEGIVVYDPLYTLDKLHAVRYLNLKKLKLPGVGHSIATHLQSLGVLNFIVDSFINNRNIEREFYELTRSRRFLLRYYQWMLSEENKYLTDARRNVLENYKAKYFPQVLTDAELDYVIAISEKVAHKDIAGAIKILKVILNHNSGSKKVREKIKNYRGAGAEL